MRNEYTKDIDKTAIVLSQIIAENDRAQQAQKAQMQRLNVEGTQHLDLQKQKSDLEQSRKNEDIGTLQGLSRYFGKNRSIGLEGVNVGADISASHPERPIQLTPAQTESEKSAGKAISEYEVKGGRPALEKNIQSLTEGAAELGGPGSNAPGVKKRDLYDRVVGGLSSKVGLQGLLAPTEKARADKIRNTALTIARQTDPNPTEKQIEAIMGQVYDPSSSDEGNLNRINRFMSEQKGHAKQLEDASRRYHQTGYASLGIGSPAEESLPAPKAAQPSELQQLIEMQKQLLMKKQGK